MPDGASIFETTGAWEDFATPSRDLRLLIAIDVVRGFPDRVARRPERYAMPKDKSVADVKAELESVLASELAARKFSYPRSDGSAVDAHAQGRDRPHGGARDGVQRERLRRAALGRAGQERRGVDLQAACAGSAARQDDGIPRVVPRAAPARARLADAANVLFIPRLCGDRKLTSRFYAASTNSSPAHQLEDVPCWISFISRSGLASSP